MLAEAPAIETGSDGEAAPKGGGKVRLLTLKDLDRRTKAFRATVELRRRLLGDLGGEDMASVGQQELVERAAVMGSMIRHTEAKWLDGEDMDLAGYLTAVNAYRRVLETIGLERRARDVTPSLRERAMQGPKPGSWAI